ncbi:MAG: DUF58 domain-containing protein [Planctomycetota bacterium]
MAEQIQRDFLDPKILSRLAGLTLHARHPMLGNVAGKHRSPIKGSSLEFAQYRKYVPGDDTRRLDWRAYARSDRFYIKEFEADTNLRLCLILDVSGSMGSGDGVSKIDFARRLAATLAYLAVKQGDAVGLYGAGETKPLEMAPKRNVAHLRTVLDEIGRLKAEGGTSLEESLHESAERIRQRALIVILSDLFVPPADLKSCFQHLRFRKHDVAVFHLLEQREIDFDFERPVRFVDLEGGPSVLADPEMIGKQYRKAVQTYLDELSVVTRDAAIDYHRVDIHEEPGDVLARFLLSRTPKKARR